MSIRRLLSPAHIGFLPLLAAFILNLASGKTLDLRIAEGESIELESLGSLLGIGSPLPGSIKLLSFETERYGEGNSVKAYRSVFSLAGREPERIAALEVNKPLRLGPLILTQTSWSIGIREILLEVEGRLAKTQDAFEARLADGREFRIVCTGFGEEGLVYSWSLGTELSGISAGDSFPEEFADYGIRIVSEDYVRESILTAGYRPHLSILAASSTLFLAALLLEFIISALREGRHAAP